MDRHRVAADRDFPEWPWLVDLDSDGRTEIVVPDSGPLAACGPDIGACS